MVVPQPHAFLSRVTKLLQKEYYLCRLLSEDPYSHPLSFPGSRDLWSQTLCSSFYWIDFVNLDNFAHTSNVAFHWLLMFLIFENCLSVLIEPVTYRRGIVLFPKNLLLWFHRNCIFEHIMHTLNKTLVALIF